MSAHTHDSIDWPARLAHMRRSDALEASAHTGVAQRLVADLPAGTATVVDLGCGAGGMSAAFARALRQTGGDRVLVDAVPELLSASAETATAESGGAVTVHSVLADAAAENLAELTGTADLVWASHVVHHLPDQLQATRRLTGLLNPGGRLALCEGGLPTRMLPWDVGVGRPGLEHRLELARDEWFAGMREEIPDMVRLPVGWNLVLEQSGLRDIDTFSFLVHHPAPAPPDVRTIVADRLGWLAEIGAERLCAEDRETMRRLLDPASPDYVANRDDIFLLSTRTVYLGRAAR